MSSPPNVNVYPAKHVTYTSTLGLDLPLVVLLTGFNLAFLGLALVNTGTLDRVRFIVPLGYAMIVLSGLLRLPKRPNTGLWEAKWFTNWFLLFSIGFVVMFVRSLIDGASPNALFFSSIPYLFILLVFVGQNAMDWVWINRLLILHVSIGIVVVTYSIIDADQSRYFVSGSAARDYVLSNTTMHDTLSLLYGYPFLIVTYAQQPKYAKWVTIAATVVTIVAGVFGQFRGTVMMPLIFLAFLIFSVYRSKSTSPRRLILPIAVLCAFLVVLFQFNTILGSNLLGSGVNGLRQRFETSLADGLGFSDRIDEATYVLEDMQPYDLLMGKGVAGTWNSERFVAYYYYKFGIIPAYEEEREMAHFGPAHMILKGGVPLLIVYLFFPFAVGWKRLLTSRKPFVLAAAAVVVGYSLQWLIAVFPSASLSYALVMLCAGQCILKDSDITPWFSPFPDRDIGSAKRTRSPLHLSSVRSS